MMKFTFKYFCSECSQPFYSGMQLDIDDPTADLCGQCLADLQAEDDASHTYESVPQEELDDEQLSDLAQVYHDAMMAYMEEGHDDFPTENDLWVAEQIEGQRVDELKLMQEMRGWNEYATGGHVASDFTGGMNQERGDDVPF